MTNYNTLISAHAKAKQSLILHGSSGYGKSTIVKNYAKANGMKYVEVRCPTLDPNSIANPAKNADTQTFSLYLIDFFADLTKPDTSPTVLFFDEFNRVEYPALLGMFTEVLLDRSILGRKLSDNVVILGACNFGTEDNGVVDIPQAVMTRSTHIVHSPSQQELDNHFDSETSKQFSMQFPETLGAPADGGEILDNLSYNKRQREAAFALWETGLLEVSDMQQVFVGKLGREHGNIMFGKFRDFVANKKNEFPAVFNETTFAQVSAIEQDGKIIEVVNYLKQQQGQERVCQYLLKHGLPETVASYRGLFDKSWDYSMNNTQGLPEQVRPHVDFNRETTKSFKMWAYVLNKLTVRLQ